MEVIHRGTHPDDHSYIVSCYRCSSTMRVTKKDATQTSERSLGHYLFMIKCPVCDAFINVSENNKEKEELKSRERLSWYDQ